MALDPDRERIEGQIIGMCLNGRFMICLDYLKPTNFKNIFYRRLFELMSEQYLREPIDPITMTRQYAIKYMDQRAVDICNLANEYLGSEPSSYSILLLQIDVRAKFTDLLKEYEKASVNETDFESAAIWKQCTDYLDDPKTDIFSGIETIYTYLLKNKPDETLEFEALMEAVPKLIDRLKKQAQANLLIENLKRLSYDSANRNVLVETASRILLTLLIKPEIPRELGEMLTYFRERIE